jgi:hypothetical protein
MDVPALGSASQLGLSSDGLIAAPGAAAPGAPLPMSGGIGNMPAERAVPQSPSKRHAGITEWTYHEHRVTKTAQGLGLDIADDDDGLRVTGVVPGGAADRTNVWHVGDVIVSVNGHLVRGKPASAKIDMLRQAQGEVRFGVIVRSYGPSGGSGGAGGAGGAAGAAYQPGAGAVTTEYYFDDGIVEKDEEEGFGLDIAVLDEEGVLVTGVVPGGAADRARFIRPHDRIVMLNDKPVVGLSQLEVVERLRTLKGPVKFSILAANHLHPRHRPEQAPATAGGDDVRPSEAGRDNRNCVVS